MTPCCELSEQWRYLEISVAVVLNTKETVPYPTMHDNTFDVMPSIRYVQGVQQFLANFDAFLQRQNLNEIWSVADVQG
jgi:hypothetical protein